MSDKVGRAVPGDIQELKKSEFPFACARCSRENPKGAACMPIKPPKGVLAPGHFHHLCYLPDRSAGNTRTSKTIVLELPLARDAAEIVHVKRAIVEK